MAYAGVCAGKRKQRGTPNISGPSLSSHSLTAKQLVNTESLSFYDTDKRWLWAFCLKQQQLIRC